MEMLSGYSVIAQRPVNGGNLRHGERVILAVRDLSPAYIGYEYVVARTAAREDGIGFWHNGHYFRDDSTSGTEPAIVRATARFLSY